MKKLSFAAGVSAIALAATTIIPVAGVFATTATYDGTNNIVTLQRTVSGVSNPVTNTFTYTITNTDKPDGATVTGAPTSASIAFNGSESVATGSAVKTTTIDFANADFSKPGDYTWTISETGTGNTANYPIDTADNDYTVIVSVRNVLDGDNVPTGAYTGSLILKNKAGTKVDTATWTSAASLTYISATAKTTGNLAETDQCFAYTLTIPATGSVNAGDKFTINNTSTCTGSDTEVTAGTAATIYLKHGDAITVGQKDGTNELPVGASYTWTKASDTSTGYTNKIDGTTAATITKTTVAVSDDNFNTANVTAFENNKDADPQTGIITNIWFYIILLTIGAFGIFFIIARRKKEDEEE